MTSPFSPPVERHGDRFTMRIGRDERKLVVRLLSELVQLLRSDDAEAQHLLNRLFPVVYPDDPELEAEYQRLMRDDLVQSKVASIEMVRGVFGGRGSTVSLSEGELMAFMQSTNSVRLVLGTLLNITDDDDDEDELDDVDEASGEAMQSPERALYVYLSWMLDASVNALTP